MKNAPRRGIVCALFCGLPRQEHRMAVFVAASDETSGRDENCIYHYSGWVAPEQDWSRYFSPAWQEQVLNGPPKIPYLHMTDIRRQQWRDEHKIARDDADWRMDIAAIVIKQMGSLYPLNLQIDGSRFKPLFKEHTVVLPAGGEKRFLPDFLAFLSYAWCVLAYVKAKHPCAEKVDFMVERNSDITRYMNAFYDQLPAALVKIKSPELVDLMGDFVPVDKHRPPVQAADYLCWLSRRAEENALGERDLKRFGTISCRQGFKLALPDSVLTGLAESFSKNGLSREEINRIRSVRKDNTEPDERSARTDKGGRRRTKGGQTKKKAEG
jgi:hypothetical protein